MIKVVTIIGARPQFIKASMLSRLFLAQANFKEILVHTGQHYDQNMSHIFFEELSIPLPNYNLNIHEETPAKQIASMIIELEKVIKAENPNFILVYGDTNSTVAGALTGIKMDLPVIHVESGLRSFDKSMPEEINRIITDHCSSLHFCPSQTAVENLKKEGITFQIFNVGDIMYDSILFFSKIAETKVTILQKLNRVSKNYVLLTIHRASNTDNEENLRSILNGFIESKEQIIFPIHPRTLKKMKKTGMLEKYQNQNIQFIEPVGYLEMIALEKHAKVIATDSGGMQKEAYFLQTPCITLRDTTEWVETITSNSNILVHTDPQKIVSALKNYPKTIPHTSFYGDGNAAVKIVSILNNLYK